MSGFSSPSDIAREALRQLALRRVPPTPDNYRALYNEIAGNAAEDEPVPEKFLLSLAKRLPRDSAERQRLARMVDQAIAGQDQHVIRAALAQYLAGLALDAQPAWNDLIAQLLRQWEARHAGWTTARKRESLERVLGANDPHTLFARLQGLVKSWSQVPAEDAPPAPADDATGVPAPAAGEATAPAAPRMVAAGEAGELVDTLRGLLAQTLTEVVPASLADQPELIREAAALAARIAAAPGIAPLRQHGELLRRFALKLEMAAGDAAEVRAGLLNLLRLLLENIDELVLDDQWLRGQVEVLRHVLDEPADLRSLDDAERRLKEVIYKQSQLKHNLTEAQQAIKGMIAQFIDQLADFAESTGSYHDTVDHCAQKISAARDITEIGGVLDEVMRETRAIQQHATRSRAELLATRQRVEDAEARIAELQAELDRASSLVTQDPLTGALNRRGLEDMFAREAARASRRRSPLCVALLDLDNFKRLNDTYGHQRGDGALIHLVRVMRENLRPHDSVARYGGEEFILLYPETGLTEATAALTRLQRALTTAFFLADNQKVFITFSAGVTPWVPGEAFDTVVQRADAAMYRAKQSGKNRVETAAMD
ncbi:GGDEF domain-containing protein [Pseudothauera rhizosphaerae]|uniref:diguanylate cyclase n=1 Tax=Pseudothauera rhizosphaerae TaxID=2565932 RepID=A0A4S4AXU0_9RHOO|nr:GGDEF domain-containing protein [Pseudothauera rhizosphaerae]THF64138.1 diguanylate cyclase [Pseudothauera rhizosphaerae]